MRFIVAIVAFACLAAALKSPNTGRDLETQLEGYSFAEYVLDFEKNYDAADYAKREDIFNANLEEIKRLNSRIGRRWNAGVNKFTDMTPTELKRYRGHTMSQILEKRAMMPLAPDFSAHQFEALPASIDWRTHQPSVVTDVKDQGSCGSCWAHSATESIESAVALATGKLFELSRQQIMRCTKNPNDCGGTGQCEGATAELGFGYVAGEGGVATEAAYPYTGSDGDCQDSTLQKVATVTNFVALPTNNYTSLMTAIATVGPVSISVDASSWSFYSSGVYDGCSYSSIDIDHAVQLVGYGVDPSGNTPYWLVRNSWSAGWGENGYIRILRHTANTPCGIDYSPSDGSGCTGGPSQITVCGTCGILSDSSYPTGAKLVN